MASDIETKVRQILAEQALLDLSHVTPDKTLDDIAIDSMALVESIFAIEESFDIDVPFNANEPGVGDFDITSVASIIAAVEKLVAEQKP